MIAVHIALWRSLFASAVLAAGVSPVGAPAPPRETTCDPTWCRLVRPTAAEFDGIVAEADRLLARYADDQTPLGRQCHALGATMKERAGDVRMIEYMWRAVDPYGNLAPVTGDAHRTETIAGTGVVHIARGFDALNPDRGLPAILQTARHEFAHLNGVGQDDRWGVDTAAHVATACGDRPEESAPPAVTHVQPAGRAPR
jgi:hypothetical protein